MQRQISNLETNLVLDAYLGTESCTVEARVLLKFVGAFLVQDNCSNLQFCTSGKL